MDVTIPAHYEEHWHTLSPDLPTRIEVSNILLGWKVLKYLDIGMSETKKKLCAGVWGLLHWIVFPCAKIFLKKYSYCHQQYHTISHHINIRITTATKLTFSVLASPSSSTLLLSSSIGSLRLLVPMMSSRNSSMPSSCSDWALGFIWAICSTSP